MENHSRQINKDEKALLSVAISANLSLIAFFSLTEEDQLTILPNVTEERKYDFPDGDHISSNAVDILLNAYESSCLNSVSINLMWMSDTNDKDAADRNSPVGKLISELHSLVKQATSAISQCGPDAQSSLRSLPQIERIRELSNIVMAASGIKIHLTRDIMQLV